jgi:hypothetical protein
MTTTAAAQPKWQLWTGRVLSAIPVLMLLPSAGMKLSGNAEIMKNLVDKYGYPASSIVPIAVVEILCAILYAVPRTAGVGAVLVTGYAGGAVATHVAAGEPFFGAVVLGIVAWAGLWLRDANVRALMPLRSPTPR